MVATWSTSFVTLFPFLSSADTLSLNSFQVRARALAYSSVSRAEVRRRRVVSLGQGMPQGSQPSEDAVAVERDFVQKKRTWVPWFMECVGRTSCVNCRLWNGSQESVQVTELTKTVEFSGALTLKDQ